MMKPIRVFRTWIARPTKRQLGQDLDSLRRQYRTLCKQIEDLRAWIVHVEGERDALSARIAAGSAALQIVDDLLGRQDETWSELECTEDFLRSHLEATHVAVQMGGWLAQNVTDLRQRLEAIQDAVDRVGEALNPPSEENPPQPQRRT